MSTGRSSKRAQQKQKNKRYVSWGWLAGFAAASLAFAVGSLQNTIGNLASDWLKGLRQQPSLRVRYLVLDQEPRVPDNPSFPLDEHTLTKIFGSETIYVQQNDVLRKLSFLAKNIVKPEVLGRTTHPSIEEYEYLLSPQARAARINSGGTREEQWWGLQVLAPNRELLARNVFSNEVAMRIAVANPDLRDFFAISLTDSRATCSTQQKMRGHYYIEQVASPSLKLIALIIDNVSLVPATIQAFSAREYRTSGEPLRLFRALGPAAGERVTIQRLPFSIELLQPREHILIPLCIIAEKQEVWTDLSVDPPPLTRHLVSTVELGKGDRLESYRSTLGESERGFYFFGPILRVANIDAGNQRLSVRDLTLDSLTYSIFNIAGTGSCPSVAFRRHSDLSWTRPRHILVGAEGRSHEREDSRDLADFGGELVLREDDDETSVIDFLGIELVDGQGKVTWCQQSKDPTGTPLVLHRGDEVRLHCPIYPTVSARLVIKGYYAASSGSH